MGDDFFYGATLNKDNKEIKWEPDELKENGSSNLSLGPRGDHCLMLKQAIICGGKTDEINIVEVETSGYKTSTVKVPIVALTPNAQGSAATRLDLTFPDPPVVLRLLEGSGPVHIVGVHGIQLDQYEDDDDEDEEEDIDADLDEEEEDIEEAAVEEPKATKGKKRSNSNGQAPASKKKKEKEAA